MKRAYAKPEVSKVKLAAEEAVLTNCKNDTTQGPLLTTCSQFGDPICADIGS